MGNMRNRKALIFCGICKQWHVAEYDCKNAAISFRPNAPVAGRVPVKWPLDEEPLDLGAWIETIDISGITFTRLVGGVSVRLIDQDGDSFSRDYLDKEFRDLFCREIAYKSEMQWPQLSIVVLAVGVWAGVIAALI